MNLYRSTCIWSAAVPAARPPAPAISWNALKTLIRENGLENEVKVVRTGCFGLCEAGPVVHGVSGGLVLQPCEGGRRG